MHNWIRGLILVGAVLLLASGIGDALAQNFPTKAIRVAVPASPGSGIDTMTRLLAQELGGRLGQTVFIENMPGAGGNIASANVARAAPDGYTLILQITSFVVNPSLYRKITYDPVKDFQPVILAARGGHGMLAVNPALEGVNSVKDLVSLSRTRPGYFNYASPGIGTPQHFMMEIFKRASGADFTHVPYKTTGDIMNAILSRDVTAVFMAGNVTIPQAKAGKLKILASTGGQRWMETPNVPTMIESGFPDFKFEVWYGFLAPAATPGDIVRKLNAELAAVLNNASIRETLLKQGLVATTSTPEEFAALIKADLAYWAKVIKDTGITIE